MIKISGSSKNSVEYIANQIADRLAITTAPAITGYALASPIFELLNGVSGVNPEKTFQKVVQFLLEARLLTKLEHVKPQAYSLFGKSNASAGEVLCSIDPFAYVSHLSAMEYHGLTDRFPRILYATRPRGAEWRLQAQARSAKDLGENLPAYEAAGLPRLTRSKITRLDSTVIEFCERSQLGAFRLVADSSLRVATIGRVFLDMLREPALCGGIQHVADIYRRDAKLYLKLIVDEIDRHGQPIDKVRAGYLISEVCQLDTPVLASWQLLAQRGGSRKLDPDGEYTPNYSERWQLSINVASLVGRENRDE